MNKSELITYIADDTGVAKSKVLAVVDSLIVAINDSIEVGDEIALAGLGSFKTVARAAREGRNPLNGEKVKIPAKTAPKFTPAKSLKDAAARGGALRSKSKK